MGLFSRKRRSSRPRSRTSSRRTPSTRSPPTRSRTSRRLRRTPLRAASTSRTAPTTSARRPRKTIYRPRRTARRPHHRRHGAAHGGRSAQRLGHRREPGDRRLFVAGPGLRRAEDPRVLEACAPRCGTPSSSRAGPPRPGRRLRHRADHPPAGKGDRRRTRIPSRSFHRHRRAALVRPRDPHREGARGTRSSRRRFGTPYLPARGCSWLRRHGAPGTDPAAPARRAPWA